MITFLFWNIQKKPLIDRIARLVARRAVDVLVLAECASKPEDVIEAVRTEGRQHFKSVPGSASRLHLYANSSIANWELLVSDPLEGWIGFKVRIEGRTPFNLFLAHLPS